MINFTININHKKDIIVCLIISIAVLFVYGQTANHDFIDLDDGIYVFLNSHVQQGLTKDGILWAFSATDGGLWHPVVWISYMIDFEIHGMNSGGYHITNMMIHLLNGILIFFIFRITTDSTLNSAFVSLLFVMHPLRVESVAWVSERKDVLSVFFFMLTILSYINFVKSKSRVIYLLSIFIFILSGMSKPIVVTLPFVLLLFDYWPLRIMSAERFETTSINNVLKLFYIKTPYFLISFVLCIITMQSHKVNQGIHTDYQIEEMIATSLVSYIKYIEKIIFPINLGVLYPYQGKVNLYYLLFSTIFMFLFTGLSIFNRKKKPYFLFGWFWYVVTLVPVIGLFKIGYHSVADRYTYVSSTGILVILIWCVDKEFKHLGRFNLKLKVIFFLLLISIFTFLSKKQINFWKNSMTLFQHTLNVTEDNYIIHHAIAYYYSRVNKKEEAIKHYKESIRINPDFEKSYISYALYLEKINMKSECISFVIDSIKRKPHFLNLRYESSIIFLNFKMIDDALFNLYSILENDKNNAMVYYNIGVILTIKEKKSAANFYFKKALQIDPSVIRLFYTKKEKDSIINLYR